MEGGRLTERGGGGRERLKGTYRNFPTPQSPKNGQRGDRGRYDGLSSFMPNARLQLNATITEFLRADSIMEIFAILASHVDDITIFTPSKKVGDREKSKLLKTYSAIDEGLMMDFCGFRVDKNDQEIFLDQEAYIGALLGSYQVSSGDCKRTKSPINSTVIVDEGQGPPNKKVQQKFWKSCGRLIYLCTYTRPDLPCAMNQLSRVAHEPHPSSFMICHCTVAIQITTK